MKITKRQLLDLISEEIEKFEDAYIPIFDIDEDEEYTFEMSNIHKEFQQINKYCKKNKSDFI